LNNIDETTGNFILAGPLVIIFDSFAPLRLCVLCDTHSRPDLMIDMHSNYEQTKTMNAMSKFKPMHATRLVIWVAGICASLQSSR
jgi:hypothetical protein